MTIDGYVASHKGEMDWMTMPWTEDLNAYVDKIMQPVDTILLGRRLAEGFIPYWQGVAEDGSNPEQAAGKMYTDTQKVVFTKLETKPDWPNTTLARGEIKQEVHGLKEQKGQDMIAYGGAEFVSGLIRHDLVDEYHLFINPVAIGKGKPIFADLDARLNLVLAESTTFDCGVVVLKYIPMRS